MTIRVTSNGPVTPNRPRTSNKHVTFNGRLVMLGFGSIGQGVLPLILRHIDMPRERIHVLAADERGAAALGDVDAEAVMRVCHGRRTEDTVAEFVTPQQLAVAVARLQALELGDFDGVHALPGAQQLLERAKHLLGRRVHELEAHFGRDAAAPHAAPLLICASVRQLAASASASRRKRKGAVIARCLAGRAGQR